jgi:hypothetical protein
VRLKTVGRIIAINLREIEKTILYTFHSFLDRLHDLQSFWKPLYEPLRTGPFAQ